MCARRLHGCCEMSCHFMSCHVIRCHLMWWDFFMWCAVMWWAVICCEVMWCNGMGSYESVMRCGWLWGHVVWSKRECDVENWKMVWWSLLQSTKSTTQEKVLPSTTPYYKLSHSVVQNTFKYYVTTLYYKMLQSTTLRYKVLLRTTKYYKVLQSTSPYYKVPVVPQETVAEVSRMGNP